MNLKLICLAIFTLLATNNSKAQTVTLGPEIGINIIKTSQTDIAKIYQPSLNLGAKFNYYFTESLSVRTGLNYTQTHQDFSSYDTSVAAFASLLGLGELGLEGFDLNTYSSTSGRVMQNYIQLPVMVDFNYNNFVVFGGGYVGYMFSAFTRTLQINRTPFASTLDIGSLIGELDGTGLLGALIPPPYQENLTESSSKANLRTIDLGLKFGLGYQLDNLEINGAYLIGLSDYRSSGLTTPKQTHQYLQLNLNYNFSLGSKDAPGFESKGSKRIKLK